MLRRDDGRPKADWDVVVKLWDPQADGLRNPGWPTRLRACLALAPPRATAGPLRVPEAEKGGMPFSKDT